MLRVRNNNIRLVRGDTALLGFVVTDINGVPYIPPIVEELESVAMHVGFVIKTGIDGSIVYENYLDIKNSPISLYEVDGGKLVTDDSRGYADFATQVIKHFDTLGYAQDALNDNDTGKLLVVSYSDDDGKYKYITLLKNGTNNYVCTYEFNIGLQIESENTIKLYTQNYVYDVSLLIGPEVTDKPIQDIWYKQTLIPTHNFIVEDSING